MTIALPEHKFRAATDAPLSNSDTDSDTTNQPRERRTHAVLRERGGFRQFGHRAQSTKTPVFDMQSMAPDAAQQQRIDEFRDLLGSAAAAERQFQATADELEALRTGLDTLIRDLAEHDILEEHTAERVRDAVEAGRFERAKDLLADAIEEGSA